MSDVAKIGTKPWVKVTPEAWRIDRLANVAEILFSNVDKHTLEQETPVQLCNYVDVYKNSWIDRRIAFMAASADDREIQKFQLKRGDVLVTKDSESPDDIAIGALVADDLPGVLCGYHLAMIRPQRGRVSGAFLAWLFADKTFRGHFEERAVGVTRFGLSQSAFRSVRIPLPALSEQLRIAAYLDTSCGAIDAAVAAKRKQIETLDALRAATLQRIVTQGLRPDGPMLDTGNAWLEQIPAGWSLVQLKRVAEVHGGLTLGKSYEGLELVEYPYLRVANVQDGRLDLTDVTTLEVPPAVAEGVMLRPGDVLMTEGGDLDKLGRGTVWAGQIAPCLHQNHVFAVRCFPHKLLPHFLAYVTASRYGRDYFEATGKRTTNLAATNATKVGAFYIPLPPLAEQEALVEYLDREIGRLKAIQEVIGKQIDTLIAYRKSLIHECVTGQRRISEADLARVGARLPEAEACA